MDSTLGRAALRPAVIGLAALLAGFCVEWPKRLDRVAEREMLAGDVGASVSVPKRPALASLPPGESQAPFSAMPKAAPPPGPQRTSSFADRFAAVFWFNGDDEGELVVRREADASPEADDLEEVPRTPKVHDERRTAFYVISAHAVLLPNGERLEAHSGLGFRTDDPRYVNVKNRGPTPPNVYDLVLRESRFHGVRAIRLIPVDESKMYGRDGMLAHSYMLRGVQGQSNGCVVFRDYPAFLNAFLRGEVDRLVVVDHLEDMPETHRDVGTANLQHHAKRRLKHVAER
jgi:hypothetical protein